MKEPYDWDTYAPYYFPKAEELAKRAADAEKAGEKEKACELYLCVFLYLVVWHYVHYFAAGEARPSGASRVSRSHGQKSNYMPGRWAKKSS